MNMYRAAAIALAFVATSSASAGTAALIEDLDSSEVIASTAPWFQGAANGRALFAGALPQEQGQRLFRSDGTSEGTALIVADGLVNPTGAVEMGGRLVFFASTDATDLQKRLWVSDGTDAGTTTIDIEPDTRTLGWVASDATRGYFIASNGSGNRYDLYVTDGTAAGTTRLTTGRNASGPGFLMPTGEMYYFSSATDGTDRGLWLTDGTVAGTQLLYSMEMLGIYGLGSPMWTDANNLYMNASDPTHQRGVFRINVNTGATTMIAALYSATAAEGTIELGGLHYFLMEGMLWRSDGTVDGTYSISSALPPQMPLAPLRVVGGRIVFVNSDEETGRELWVSDGTAEGTQMLVEAGPGPDSEAQLLLSTADRAFFVAGPYDDAQFWVTDGTPAGTRKIPLRGGAAYAVGVGFFQQTKRAGDRIYFTANEIVPGPNGGQVVARLWVTDLQGTDVVRLGSAGIQLQVLGDRVLYANMHDDAGVEPWVSDGTAAGTFRLRDLAVTGKTASSSPIWLTTVGSRTFFSANEPAHGRELWVTDGTADGTRMVRDIVPGEGSSWVGALTGIGDTLYFVANDDGQNDGLGQLWRSDGTEAGTFKLAAIPVQTSCGKWIVGYDGRLWFFAANAGRVAYALWSTDGTADGTREEFILPPDIAYRELCDLTAAASGLVFAQKFSPQSPLWRTDGTLDGTQRVDGVHVAAPNGPNRWFTAVDGIAYLFGEDDAGGRELWRSDGTVAGTVRVADLTEGPNGAESFGMERFGTGLLFSYESPIGTADGLYRLAGPDANPELIKAGNISERDPILVGALAFFELQDDDTGIEGLWVTDGTAAGTREVFNTGVGSLRVFGYAAGEDRLYFGAPPTTEASHDDLWFTTGLPGGTHRISNFAPTLGFYGGNLTVLDNFAIFAYDDGVAGAEPWIVTNQPPVAVADTASLTRDTNVLIAPRANDTDPDSADDIVTLAIVAQPAHGTLVAEGAGFRYTPTTGYVGTDSFDYQLTDEFGAQSAVTRVTITVSAPPPAAGGGGGGGGGKKGGGALEWLTLAGLLAIAAGIRARSRARARTIYQAT